MALPYTIPPSKMGLPFFSVLAAPPDFPRCPISLEQIEETPANFFC